MKVVIARTAGFCKGVRDAIEITMNAIQRREKGEDIAPSDRSSITGRS